MSVFRSIVFSSVIAGIIAGAVSLIGFGLDSGIEVISAVIVVIRLAAEVHGAEPDERKEKIALRAVEAGLAERGQGAAQGARRVGDGTERGRTFADRRLQQSAPAGTRRVADEGDHEPVARRRDHLRADVAREPVGGVGGVFGAGLQHQRGELAGRRLGAGRQGLDLRPARGAWGCRRRSPTSKPCWTTWALARSLS